MKIQNYDEILRDSFGLWISGFFSAISGWNPNITFVEHKAAFFWMLEKLLAEEKIRFCPPNEFWKPGHDVWDAEVTTIVQYFHSRWPIAAQTEEDRVLIDYFYDMPAILWVGIDGELYDS